MKARIFVTLKQGVLDPQGKAVQQALARLGYNEAEDVRLGKYMEIALKENDSARAKKRLDEMCRQLLANTVIEDYRFEIIEK